MVWKSRQGGSLYLRLFAHPGCGGPSLQPIVLKIANSVGFADYTDGLVPDFVQDENILNMGVLGEMSDPYLETTINKIRGISARTIPKTSISSGQKMLFFAFHDL